MAASLAHVFAQMQRWANARLEDISDTELLERFVQRRDEAAFTGLVARHGGMVLRLCRRILGDAHAAEDTFQATFLILARKAHALKQPHALSGWLYGVARHAALKARKKNIYRDKKSLLAEDLPDTNRDPLSQLTARELLAVVDEEINRLPALQRSAMLLCCLEGRTREEAARMLGCTAGSLKGHLERGRRNLQTRLSRRGIDFSAALAIVTLSRGEAISAMALRGVVQTALHGGAGAPAMLAESVLKGMIWSKLIGLSAVAMTVALAVTVAAGMIYSPAPVEKSSVEAPAAASEPAALPRVDAQGDPLPAGAIARLGTVRFRHGTAIDFIAFTPDGKSLVSRGDDGTRIWDVSTGKELQRLATPSGRVEKATDLSPDGQRLAVGSGRGIQFWDLRSGKKADLPGAKLRGPFCFSPDGKLLAITPRPSDIELWDVEGQKMLRSWKTSEKRNWSIDFSADSRRLITSGISGEFRLWDVATGRQLQEFRMLGWIPGVRPGKLKRALALSPNGELLALIEANDKNATRISLRATVTGKLLRMLTCPAYEILPGEILPFMDLKFTPDGKQLITGGPDHLIRVWDAETGKELRRLPLDSGPPDRLALSKDGKKLAAVVFAGAKAIQVLDLTSGQAVAPSFGHPMPILHAAIAPDGRTVVTNSPFGSPFIWDTSDGRVRYRLKGPNGPFAAMQLSGDGRTLFTSGWDSTRRDWGKTLRVWEVATGEERRRFPVEGEMTWANDNQLILTPDGKTLAEMNGKNIIRFYDAVSGKERQQFQGSDRFRGMGFTADGRSLIAWSGDYKVRIWDTASGRKLREWSLPKGEEYYFNAALSPDGRLLAMEPWSRRTKEEGKKGRLRLVDLETGQIANSFDSLPSEMRGAAFSPDGRVLAWTDLADNAIHLLEVAGGRERRRFAGHRGQVTVLAFSANGERLISGSVDTTALIWDLGRRFDRRNPPPALGGAEVEKLWADLAGQDAARAFQAIRKLAFSASTAIPFLRQRLRPVPSADEKRIERLIAALDSDDFAVRRQATAELEKLGASPMTAYRRALESKPSLEKRRRLEGLLAKSARAWWILSPEQLRAVRAIEVLEWAGTKEAREALDVLAGGAAGARLTEQAEAARRRLLNRTAAAE